MGFELCCCSWDGLRRALKEWSRGQKDGGVECRDGRRCDRARCGQSSPAGAAALASFEMRKSRSYLLQVADRGRTEARLSGGESFEGQHRATTSRTVPERVRRFGRGFGRPWAPIVSRRPY